MNTATPSVPSCITTDLLEALASPDAATRQAAEQYYFHSLTADDRLQGLVQCVVSTMTTTAVSSLTTATLAPVLLRRALVADTATTDHARAVLDALVPRMATHNNANSIQDNPSPLDHCVAQACATLAVLDPTAGATAIDQVLTTLPTAAALWRAVAERAPHAYATSCAWRRCPPHSLPTLVASAAAHPDVATALRPRLEATLATVQCGTDDQNTTAWLWRWLATAADEAPGLLCPPSAGLWQCCAEGAAKGELLAVHVVCTVVATRANNNTNSGVDVSSVLPHALSACWMHLQPSDEIDDDEFEESLALHDNHHGGGASGDDAVEHAQSLLHDVVRLPGALEMLLTVVQDALTTTTQSSASTPWKLHSAALAALDVCLDSVPVAMAPHTAQAVAAAVAALSSPARVRYPALRVLGRACQDTSNKDNSDMASSVVLPALAMAMTQSADSPVCAATACQALVSYCRSPGLDVETQLLPFVPQLLDALLQSGPLGWTTTSGRMSATKLARVQVRAVGAVACVAHAVGTAFAPWYGHVVPGLVRLAQPLKDPPGATSPDLLALAGASLEAATIVGQAVPEVFATQDAHGLMQWAVAALGQTDGAAQQQEESDYHEALLSSCARMASVLGAEYAPYVDRVLPRLLERAKETSDDVDVTSTDAPANAVQRDEDAGTETLTLQVPGRPGWTRVTVNTSSLQQKVQAARAVYEHAAALGAAMGPTYTQACFDTFVPLVEYPYSADLRATAAQTLAVVFDATCLHGEETGNLQLAQTYLPKLVQVLSKQVQNEDTEDADVMFAIADSLSEVCRILYVYAPDHGMALMGNLTQDHVHTMVQQTLASLVVCLDCRSDTAQRLGEEHFASEDERRDLEAELEHRGNVLTPLVDSIGYMLKTYRTAFIPLFETMVLPVLGPYLSTGHDVGARLSAVCLFDDVVEHCGRDAAAKFSPALVDGIRRGLADSRPTSNSSSDASLAQRADLRRACIYGVAQIARYAPANTLAAHASGLVQELGQIIASPTQANVEEKDQALYENAVSALASLALFNGAPFVNAGYVKHETLVKSFLASLPLSEDVDEAKICHSGFCDLVEQGVLEAHGAIVVRCVHAILDLAEDEDVADESTCQRLQAMQARLSAQPRDGIQQQFGFANIVSP